ncbi:hypothetical protein ABK040_011565 [Willaertia magna]
MNKYHHANEEDYLTINSSTTQTTNKLFKKSTILSIIAIIISLVIAVIGILSFAATLITITIINNNNINTLLATNYDNYIENKPMLFHISEKEKFSFGLGNIENLNKVSQQLNIKIPDITIITNGNAILEYFNNETVALMKNAVDNYKTSIKCCKVALTGNLIIQMKQKPKDGLLLNDQTNPYLRPPRPDKGCCLVQ